uniref:Uncharacterized protein n=1 Tax=Cannabis sativa TaxID=3483 RepID=A0A803Q9J9_CANSA
MEALLATGNMAPNDNNPNNTIPWDNNAQKSGLKNSETYDPHKDKGKGKVGETSKKTSPTSQRKKKRTASQPPKKNKGTNASRQGNQTDSKG